MKHPDDDLDALNDIATVADTAPYSAVHQRRRREFIVANMNAAFACLDGARRGDLDAVSAILTAERLLGLATREILRKSLDDAA